MLTALVADLADRQHGVVCRDQLRAAGMTDDQIRVWLCRKKLRGLHRSVYAVGHTRLVPEGRRLAGVLACGEGAVLSHRSAAAHWGLTRVEQRLIDVSAPRSRERTNGVRLHRPRLLHPIDVTVHESVPITTVSRTLLDLAGAVPFGVLERAFNQAMVIDRLDTDEMRGAIDRAGRKRGIRAAKQIFAMLDPQAPVLTHEGVEERMLSLIRRSRLPVPEINSYVEDEQVDFFWRPQRLVVETDGRAVHLQPLAFERDRARDRKLQLKGYDVFRFTYEDITARPEQSIRTIRAALSQSRAA